MCCFVTRASRASRGSDLILALLPLAVASSASCIAGTGAGAGSDPATPPETFLYFGYGSNLLARRIHIQNPSAVRYGTARLRDYRLDFNLPFSKRWGGAPATVVPDPGEEVWGALWTMNVTDRDHLDDQEGVNLGMYDVLNVTVEAVDGEVLCARSYALHDQPSKPTSPGALPEERRPSRVYKQVILHGARESGLPEGYLRKLEAIPDNGSIGSDPPVSLDSLLFLV